MIGNYKSKWRVAFCHSSNAEAYRAHVQQSRLWEFAYQSFTYYVSAPTRYAPSTCVYIALATNKLGHVTMFTLNALGSEIMESGSEVESEKVLIEREGKFELVHASDIKAMETSFLQDQDVEHVEKKEEEGGGHLPKAASRSAEIVTELQTTGNKPDETVAAENTMPSVSNAKSTIPMAVCIEEQPELANPQGTSSDHEPSRSHEHEHEDSSLKSTVESQETNIQNENLPPAEPTTELKSTSQVRILEAQKTTASPNQARPNKDLSSGSVTVLRHPRQRMFVSRTKSAPGLRETWLGEDDTERKKRNEAAFKAWLSRKNEALEERRKLEISKQKLTEEELRQKRERNEAAFQAWLASKNREQKLGGKESRPTTSIPKCDKAASSAAFEHWMNRKRMQHQRELEENHKRQREEEEAARKADPTIVDQAYKR